MRRRLASASALLLVAFLTTHARAQIIDWTGGGATDVWDDKDNWTGGNIPDASGETARFNVAGGFPVELPGDFTVNDLVALSGLPQLRPTAGENPTLAVSDDLIASNGGGFYLSTIGDEKFTIDVNDELRIDGGGAFTADTSASNGLVTLLIDDLRLANVGTGSGDLTLIGPGTSLEQTGLSIANLGQDGPAQFTLSDRAQATFAAPLQVTNFADANSTGSVLVESGSRLTLNTLQVSRSGSNAGVDGSVTVAGTNSRITTSGATTIGGSSTPVGSLNVDANGRFDSGGQLTVNPSGILNVDGGTLTAMAGLNAIAGTLNHADGLINVTGGSFIPVDDQVVSEYVLEGVGTPEVVIGAGGDFSLLTDLSVAQTRRGSLRVEAGGDANISAPAYVGEEFGGFGELTISGSGSTFTSAELNVGDAGLGVMRIEAGGFADVFNLDLGVEEGSTGRLEVAGAGSRLFTDLSSVQGGTVQVARRGDGRLDITAGGVVDAHNLLVANNTLTSTQTGEVVVIAGQINLTNDLRAGLSGTADIEVLNGGSIVVDDETQLGEGATLTIGGSQVNSAASFQTGQFDGQGGRFILERGSLTVTDTNQKLIVEPSRMSIGGVEIENNSNFPTSLTSTQTVTLAGDVVITPGAELSLGSVLTAGGLQIATGGALFAPQFNPLIINGPVATAVGSEIALNGVSMLGDANAPNGVLIAGELIVGTNDLTLLDLNDVVFDSGAFVFMLSQDTEIFADNGLTIDFGANVTGEGSLVTPNDPTKPLTNNGHIAGVSPTRPITLTGYVKGVGTCDNCVITGTDAPGFSPATVVRGSVAYRGVLEIEIGGTSSGDFDRLEHLLGAGEADLGGELHVVLIDGYQLASGDQIEFLTAAAVTGAFDTETLPTLGGGLDAQLVYGAGSVTLAVVGVEGDYNYDGVVDAADYTVWRDSLGQTGDGLAADGDNNGVIEQADYAVWQANYGAAAVSLAVAVPEPTALTLLALSGLFAWRPRKLHGLFS